MSSNNVSYKDGNIKRQFITLLFFKLKLTKRKLYQILLKQNRIFRNSSLHYCKEFLCKNIRRV